MDIDQVTKQMAVESVQQPGRGRLRVWVNRVCIFGLSVVLLLGVACLVVYQTHGHLIVGIPLEEVPDSSSLSSVFPRIEGWSQKPLEAARVYAEDSKSTAFIAIQDGQLVVEWGDTARRISAHSVRKSMVSALFGVAVHKGLINIEDTLSDIGFDDEPPLNEAELSARIRDLLTCRSGIYHGSVKSDGSDEPPPRGTHSPGEVFYYNNWSFNALGAIFEEETQLSLGQAFKDWIGDPIGMQDFRVEDVRYFSSGESRIPAYRFWISARDLARFGVLFQQKGLWNGVQVIPEEWVDDSVRSHSMLGPTGYGYMWWIRENGDWMATGTGGQKVIIDPERRLVLVNRVDTGEGFGRGVWFSFGPRMNNGHMRQLKELILSAAPASRVGS